MRPPPHRPQGDPLSVDRLRPDRAPVAGRNPCAVRRRGPQADAEHDLDRPGRRARRRRATGPAFDELVRRTYVDTLHARATGSPATRRTPATWCRRPTSGPTGGSSGFRGDAQFTTWLYRITANCAADPPRQARHAPPRRADRRRSIGDEPAPTIDPEAALEAGRHRATGSQAALRRLPPRLRAVVVLRDVYDLPHEAIAAELGITESAAKVRLHRARRKLRADLLPPTSVDDADEGRPSPCGVTTSPTLLAASGRRLACARRADAGATSSTCLRCQAELAQYRKLLRALRALRTEVLEPAPGLLAETSPARGGGRAPGRPRAASTGRRVGLRRRSSPRPPPPGRRR